MIDILGILRIPRNKITKFIFFASADVFFVFVAVLLAFILRFEGNIAGYIPLIIEMSVFASVFVVIVFYLNGLYSFAWSYVSADELISLFKANTISFILLSIVIYFSEDFSHFESFPRSTLFISYVLTFIFSGGIRFAKRIYFHVLGMKFIAGKEATLIVGAGDAGEQILRSALSAKSGLYYPIGFVDDSPIKQGVNIHGLKVLGRVADIPSIVRAYNVVQLVIALPSAGSKAIREAVRLANSVGVKDIKILPPLTEIVNQQVSFRNLKDVDVGDLLGRDAIEIDSDAIRSFITGKKILITGAGGSIGSELSRQVAKFNPSLLLLLDQDETAIFHILQELKAAHPQLDLQTVIADVTDQKRVKKIFNKFSPQIIFHAAAYKHVPLMEENVDEAIKNNIFGTKILAETAIEYKAEKFVFISTDKAVNPTSVMGSTKRIGEMICQQLNNRFATKFVSVRFGNVLDSRGSVVPIFREQIKKGGPVQVTHPDMTRYFMLISEACLLVMQAAEMGQGGEVFVLDMGSPVKISDLAKEMIKLSGFEPDKDIAIVYTSPRPGEKLFEEILTTNENSSVTRNKKIFVAKLRTVEDDKLEKMIEGLAAAIESQVEGELEKMVKNIVSSYH